MSPPKSSSKTAALAGTLAGLLAAGLGGYYIHTHKPPAGAPSAPQSAAQSAAPTSPKADETDRKTQASLALLNLPELKAWADLIEKRSGGKAHGALIEYDPKPAQVNGKSYWQFSFVENRADAAERWESFLVSTIDGEILVEDQVDHQYLSLERWRKEKNPLRRGAD